MPFPTEKWLFLPSCKPGLLSGGSVRQQQGRSSDLGSGRPVLSSTALAGGFHLVAFR